MALQCQRVSKACTGVADDAWNELASSSVQAISSHINYPASGFEVETSPCFKPGADSLPDNMRSYSTCSITDGSSCSAGSVAMVSGTGSVFLDLPPVLIAEIFKHFDPRELSVVSCVCSLFRHLSSDSHGWKDFYCERWGIPTASTSKDAVSVLPEKTWRELYVAREARSKAFLGRFHTDIMHGHTAAIRCVRLLSSANLIFTAGYDSILRIWDLEEGLPVSWSRPLGYTVRAIAVDLKILVLGGSDAKVRVWQAVPDLFHIFDVLGVISGASEIVLSGHDGPITSLGLNETKICSGSWDMTVKVWDRSAFKCVRTLMHRDWVWALCLRGQRLVSTAGSDVYGWDIETGECFRVRAGAHVGQAYAVECSRSGHFVFTGGEDGVIRMYEDKPLRKRGSTVASGGQLCPGSEPVAYWKPHSGAVYALAFDDPWLVSASGDGSLAMMDVRKIMKKSVAQERPTTNANTKFQQSSLAVASTYAEPPQRMLVGSNQSFYSVDIGADRVVGAGEEKIVRVWDFSLALEIERRGQASRAIRLGQRLRRKESAHHKKGKQVSDACNITAKREVIERAPVWRGRGSKLKA